MGSSQPSSRAQHDIYWIQGPVDGRAMKLVRDEVAEASDAEVELLSIITPERHPTLTAALAGNYGPRFRAELAQLLRGRYKVRAPRRPVTRLARLQFLRED